MSTFSLAHEGSNALTSVLRGTNFRNLHAAHGPEATAHVTSTTRPVAVNIDGSAHCVSALSGRGGRSLRHALALCWSVCCPSFLPLLFTPRGPRNSSFRRWLLCACPTRVAGRATLPSLSASGGTPAAAPLQPPTLMDGRSDERNGSADESCCPPPEDIGGGAAGSPSAVCLLVAARSRSVGRG